MYTMYMAHTYKGRSHWKQQQQTNQTNSNRYNNSNDKIHKWTIFAGKTIEVCRAPIRYNINKNNNKIKRIHCISVFKMTHKELHVP